MPGAAENSDALESNDDVVRLSDTLLEKLERVPDDADGTEPSDELDVTRRGPMCSALATAAAAAAERCDEADEKLRAEGLGRGRATSDGSASWYGWT